MTPTGKLEQKMKSLITLVTDGWKVKRILTYDNGLTIISDLTCSFLAAVTAAVINCLQFHLARVYIHTHTHTHTIRYTQLLGIRHSAARFAMRTVCGWHRRRYRSLKGYLTPQFLMRYHASVCATIKRTAF